MAVIGCRKVGKCYRLRGEGASRNLMNMGRPGGRDRRNTGEGLSLGRAKPLRPMCGNRTKRPRPSR